jgi:hypothetical protein
VPLLGLYVTTLQMRLQYLRIFWGKTKRCTAYSSNKTSMSQALKPFDWPSNGLLSQPSQKECPLATAVLNRLLMT